MYFDTKKYLKNTHNHTFKQSLKHLLFKYRAAKDIKITKIYSKILFV